MGQRVVFAVGGVKYAVVQPTPAVIAQGEHLYRRALQKAISAAAPRERDLEGRLRRKGVWDDTKQAEAERLKSAMTDCQVASELGQLRLKYLDLVRERLKEECRTAEAQARNTQFDYYVSKCLIRLDTNKSVYQTLGDYRRHAADPVASEGASRLFTMLTGQSAWAELASLSLGAN